MTIERRNVELIGTPFEVRRLGYCGSTSGYEVATLQHMRCEERYQSSRNKSGWTRWTYVELNQEMSCVPAGDWANTDH